WAHAELHAPGGVRGGGATVPDAGAGGTADGRPVGNALRGVPAVAFDRAPMCHRSSPPGWPLDRCAHRTSLAGMRPWQHAHAPALMGHNHATSSRSGAALLRHLATAAALRESATL